MLRIWPALALFATAAAPLAYAQASVSGPVTLSPGDIIKLEVWREEDMTGEFLIDESGNVTLPLLGERRAAGIPLPELRSQLLNDFRLHLTNPSINITPLRRVFVLGEVNEPGLVEADPTISLAGAVALAGGATAAGDLSRIRIVRDGEVVLDGVSMQAGLHQWDIRSGDQIFVGQRSWFDRNSPFVVSALISVTSIVISLLR